MDKAYLESFTEQQLEHYANTLQRRIKDLRQLTIDLTSQNQELGQVYEDLIQQKTFVYHKNQKKKKSWSNWFNKSKEKIGTFLHITKPSHNDQNAQKQVEDKPEGPSPYHIEEEEPQGNENTPKRKVLNLLEIGKEKITKLFHSNKSKEEVKQQEGGQGMNYDIQQNRFQFLSQLVKDNTNHENKYSQFIQRTQEQRLKREQPEQPSNQKRKSPEAKFKEQKKQPSSFEKITKHVLSNRGVEQNSTLQIQTTAFQPSQEPPKQEAKIINEVGNRQEVEQEIKEKGQSTQQEVVIVESNPAKQAVQQSDPQQNQYAVRYDEPINNYQLEEGAVSQIVEKQAPSQDELESPTKAIPKPSPQQEAKQKPAQSK